MECKRAINSNRGWVVRGNLINFHCMSPDKLLLNCVFAFLAVFFDTFFCSFHQTSPSVRIYIFLFFQRNTNGSWLVLMAHIPRKQKRLIDIVKVSKFRKQIFLLSFQPKNERNYFLISALTSKNIKKLKTLYYIN